MSQPSSAAGVTQFVTPRPDERKVVSLVPEPVTATEHTSEVPTPQAEPVVKEERPIPTMGLPALWYGIKKSFNEHATPPKLSKKELTFLSEQAIKAEEERLRELAAQRLYASYLRIRELADECTHLVVAFIGVKGAAATTTTMVNVTSMIANDTRTLVYGADFNPASGTAAAQLGKEHGETISIQEFAAIVDDLKGDRKSVNQRLRPTRYGVRVLSADDYTTIPGEQYGTTTSKMLNVLDENCDYLMLDTPNDITTPAARAVIAKADVIVFTANVGEPTSMRLLRHSMDVVRALGYEDKVADSVVVISNVPPGMSPIDYRKYLGKVTLDHTVTSELQPGEFRGQMLTVPSDPAIARNGVVNLEAYAQEALQAYRDIDIAIFEQALAMRSRSTLSALGRS